MSRSLKFYVRTALFTLAAMALTVPAILWGCWYGFDGARNAPILWLPPDFTQRRELEEFIDDFRADDVIVVSWEGCTVDDPRLQQFADEIRSPRWEQFRKDHTHLTGQVLTGYEALRALTSEPLDLSREEAVRRLEGQLVGPDGRTSCAVLVTRWTDVEHGRGAIPFIIDTAEKVGVPRDEIRLAGSHVEGAAIDASSSRSFVLYLPPSALFSILLCRFFLKSWRLTLAVLSVAAFGGGFVLALAYFAGATLNAVLIVMTPLVLVVALSSGIHLVNYFLEQERRRITPEAAARAALRVAWRPCLLAAATTAVGLASLVVSDLEPLRQFGLFAAVGVLLSIALLFLIVPGAFFWYSRRGSSSSESRRPSEIPPAEERWTGYASWVQRFSPHVVLAGFLVLAVGMVGLSHVRTSVSIYNLLPEDHPLIRDYRWMETNLGPLAPVEIVLHFDEDSPLDMLQQAALVRQVQESVDQLEMVDGAISAATFLPEFPTGRGFRETTRRAYLRRLLLENREQLIEAHWLSTADGGLSWRISARVPAFADLDYGRVMNDLHRQVEPIVNEQPGEIGVTFTGITPVVHAAQQQLLIDLFTSFLTALAMVTVVMMLVLRSISAGLVAMIPNLFPAATIFGLMGWLDLRVDIGSVMTASVALGIAVDDTLHFLTWFRRALSNGSTRFEAIRFSLGHCGAAMVQTTLICGLGLMVFGLSEFIPTRRFALMMFATLGVALAGDLLLLPALLASPLGKVFKTRTAPTPSLEPAQSA